MGTFRSTYPMMPESNQRTSIPQFAWFHPGNHVASTRTTSFNVFQGTPTNPEGITPIPIRSMAPVNEAPVNQATNNLDPNLETQPARPTKKKPKISNELKPKPTKNGPSKPTKTKASGSPSTKRDRKNLNFASYESSMDASGIPAPVCTCTGVARQCYRWGAGGWQSSCCTINVSEYPLPMSTTRPGSRMAGRKMSNGAYDKLLQRLATEGYNLSHPIDLKDHWAKHGTNKFVTKK